MRIGIISVFSDHHRQGRHYRGMAQPLIGPVIAALLPASAEVEVINDTWEDPDWTRDYDLLFLSCMHPDFDRARQISHYWRKRGAATVLGGIMATNYPDLCAPYFDTIVVGDPESTVPAIYADFANRRLRARYVSTPYDGGAIRTPRLETIAHKAVVPLAWEVTRGCPFACDFCALTAIGTRFHTRPARQVADEIVAAQRKYAGLIAPHMRNFVMFYDNNIGGSPAYLKELCAEFRRIGIKWGACITFNILRRPELVDVLSAGGCRALYVGVESFNPAALASMNKRQNVVAEVGEVIDRCRRAGILFTSGLLVCPAHDDLAYIHALPARLRECGLHVPEFITFETAFPGTPYFNRLARASEPGFLPNVMLRDLNGYMLTARPRHASPEDYVQAYRETLDTVFSRRNKLRKLMADVPRFLASGFAVPALVDIKNMLSLSFRPYANRTYLPETELEPPETVPLADADFDSEEQARLVREPWRISDERGQVLPMWLGAQPVFRKNGKQVIVAAPQPAGGLTPRPKQTMPSAALAEA